MEKLTRKKKHIYPLRIQNQKFNLKDATLSYWLKKKKPEPNDPNSSSYHFL